MRVILAACFLSLCLSAHGASRDAKSDTSTRERIVVLVDEIKAIRSFPIVLAERLGYFRDEGVDVTVMNIRDDVPYMDMLEDHRIDAVMAYYHHTVVAQSEGKDIRAVVALGMTPGAKILVANQVRDKYRTPADLKGSRIITGGAGSSKTTIANYLLVAGGHQIADYVRLAADKKDANLAALRDGSADLVVAPTPDGTFYENSGAASVFADLTTVAGTRKALGVLFPSNTLFMSGALIRQRPQVAQHLVNALVRTLKFINAHSPEEIAAQVPVEVSGKDRDAYLKVLKEEIPMYATDGRMPADAAAGELRVLAAFEPKYKGVDVTKTYTNEFVDRALKTVH